jgi:hypothetical protein
MSLAKIYMHQIPDPPPHFTFDLETTSGPIQKMLEDKIAEKLDEKTNKGKKLDKVMGQTIPFSIKNGGVRYTLSVEVRGHGFITGAKLLEYRLCLMSYSYRALT